MNNIVLTFSVAGLVLWILWLVIVLAGLSLAVGSRREMEPRATRIFGVATAVFAVAGAVIIRFWTGG